MNHSLVEPNMYHVFLAKALLYEWSCEEDLPKVVVSTDWGDSGSEKSVTTSKYTKYIC